MDGSAIRFWRALEGVAVVLICVLFFSRPGLPGEIVTGTSALKATATVYSQNGESMPTSSNKVVFANTKTFIQGWTEYNIFTCALIDSGTTKALTPPKHGTLAYGVQSFKLGASTGSCAGTVLPFSVTYYTWTDTTTTAKDDAFELEWFTADGEFTEDTNWTITLGPRIYFNGKDVTNTTQTVALGQKIALTTMPTETGQTQSWGGDLSKTVGGYVHGATGAVTPTNFTKSSTTFFWTTLGTKPVT